LFTLKQLQTENLAWVEKNFHNTRIPFDGIVEETGELAEAIDVVCSDSPPEILDRVADAIADAIIYMSDFCNIQGFSLENIVALSPDMTVDAIDPFMTGMSILGRVAHSKLKLHQGIRGKAEKHRSELQYHLGQLYRFYENMALHYLAGIEVLKDSRGVGIIYTGNQSLLLVIERVWEQVSKRDWTANKLTGISDVDG
jgi:NTP pyrophosphatase (non-canonical NTP hydrolase)